jgi:hypothetical protein
MIRNNGNSFGGNFAVDTTLVLFFIAMEIGQSAELFSVDTLLMSITMMMVLVLPYFLFGDTEPPAFSSWLSGRIAVGIIGLGSGLAFRMSLGTLLPEGIKFIPMTLLIVTAMISCYLRMYSLMKLRLVK